MEQLETGTFKTLQAPKKQKRGAVIWLLVGLHIILPVLCGWLTWQWYTLQQQKNALQTSNTELMTQVTELKAKIAMLETTPSPDGGAPACDGSISDEIKTTIRTAVESHTFAPLESYMTDPVRVILAASEGIGDRTPAQAVADMAYVNSGTLPWDFNLPAATLTALDAGFYTDYFDANTYVGKSSDDMVIAFDFDSCGKINKIFMAANIDLLL